MSVSLKKGERVALSKDVLQTESPYALVGTQQNTMMMEILIQMHPLLLLQKQG